MSTSWLMLSLRPTAPREGLNIIGGNVMQQSLSGPVRRAALEAATVGEFLLDLVPRGIGPWKIAAIVLLPLAVGLTVIETNSFWVAGLSGIEDHRMVPPFDSRHYHIGDARTLTTGCDHIDDKDYI